MRLQLQRAAVLALSALALAHLSLAPRPGHGSEYDDGYSVGYSEGYSQGSEAAVSEATTTMPETVEEEGDEGGGC